MLPPILEIYVIWHPSDRDGKRIASETVAHFHGTTYSGLIGGAVEVYVRSTGWATEEDAPRPLPTTQALPNQLPSAQLTAVVPVIGAYLARAVGNPDSPWHTFLESLVRAAADQPTTVGIYPVLLDPNAMRGTLGEILGHLQRLDPPEPTGDVEADARVRSRDLAQAIAQLAGGDRLTVLISHTKRFSAIEGRDRVDKLIATVRRVIANTRLAEFFDTHDLQPGKDWEAELVAQASTSALLALRTDRFSSRTWCQREIALAKDNGMPIVVLDALYSGEERGSFLMDHVPRVPLWSPALADEEAAAENALNILVDECLKRALWNRQCDRLRDLGFSWLPSRAPEPSTLIRRLHNEGAQGALRILHPDPPLGQQEQEVLQDIVRLLGTETEVDIMTPRTFAGRGGGASE